MADEKGMIELEREVARLGERVESLKGQLDRQNTVRARALDYLPSSAVLAAIVGIFVFMFAQYAQIGDRLDRVETRLESVETRLDSIEQTLMRVVGRLEAIERKLP